MNLDFVLANEIKYIIKEKQLKEGECLPSERELCAIFNVQRLTIRSALHLLEEEGMIYTKPKSGYYVNKPRVIINAKNIASLTNELFSLSNNVLTKLISFEKIEVGKHFIACLKLLIGTPIYIVKRLRIVDDDPVCVNISYIPVAKCPDLDKYDLEKGSLYKIINDEYHIQLKKSEQIVDVVYADKTILPLLKIQSHEKIIYQHGSVFDNNDNLIEYSESYMKPNRFMYKS
ncbi:MAG: GntR family transcriptional regulator [Herbinix sp.]|nr:GntR family transcriptional regulator [Herbinix sp.]